MDTDDPNFDETIYSEELARRISKEAERITGLPAEQLHIYLSKFEPEGLVVGEAPEVSIKMTISEDVQEFDDYIAAQETAPTKEVIETVKAKYGNPPPEWFEQSDKESNT